MINLVSGSIYVSFRCASFQNSEASMSAQAHLYSFWTELQNLALMALMKLEEVFCEYHNDEETADQIDTDMDC